MHMYCVVHVCALVMCMCMSVYSSSYKSNIVMLSYVIVMVTGSIVYFHYTHDSHFINICFLTQLHVAILDICNTIYGRSCMCIYPCSKLENYNYYYYFYSLMIIFVVMSISNEGCYVVMHTSNKKIS